LSKRLLKGVDLRVTAVGSACRLYGLACSKKSRYRAICSNPRLRL